MTVEGEIVVITVAIAVAVVSLMIDTWRQERQLDHHSGQERPGTLTLTPGSQPHQVATPPCLLVRTMAGEERMVRIL